MSAVGYAVRSAYAGNFGGKRTGPVDQIVIHTTEASAESALSWFGMPHGAAGPTSAHYVVGQDGTVTQAVPDDRVAWHAGNRAINGRSIGIENEGHAADPATWTPALLDALAGLCAQLSNRYGVPVRHAEWNEPGFIGHVDVPNQDHTDPGRFFDWAAFLNRVAARTAGVA